MGSSVADAAAVRSRAATRPGLQSRRNLPSSGGLATSRSPGARLAGGGLRPANVQLALDPLLPASLSLSRPIWHWLLAHLLILACFGASYAFVMLSLPPSLWGEDGVRLVLAGWAAHLLGAVVFLAQAMALIVKKKPFHRVILCAVLLAIVAFLCGTLLHTSQLGPAAELARLRDSGQPDAQMSDVVWDGTNLFASFRVGGHVRLALSLQWAGVLLLLLLLLGLVSHAPSATLSLATASHVAKHKQLLDIRQLVLTHNLLAQQLADHEAMLAAGVAGGSMGGSASGADTPLRPPSFSPPPPSASRVQRGGGAEVLTFDRPNTGAGSAPPTPLLEMTGGGALKTSRGGFRLAASRVADLPLDEAAEEDLQRVRQLQQALQEETLALQMEH